MMNRPPMPMKRMPPKPMDPKARMAAMKRAADKAKRGQC